MDSLTPKQMERLDLVDNTIHQMLCDLAGCDIEWHTEYIYEIAELAEELICNKLKLMTEMAFRPYLEGVGNEP